MTHPGLDHWFDPARVVDIPGAPEHHQAVALVAEAASQGFTREVHDAFVAAVLEREQVASTAIGGGVAVPHARMRGLDACRVAVGRCPAGIDFGAPDGAPVRLLFMLATRDSDRLEHLRLLATLAALVRRPGLVEAVLAAEDGRRVAALLAGGAPAVAG